MNCFQRMRSFNDARQRLKAAGMLQSVIAAYSSAVAVSGNMVVR